jgi:glutathione S-transferase
MCEELGIPYDHIAMTTQDGATRQPAYLKINPSGHIPAIDDGGFTLSESMAINLYLAKKHGKFYPTKLQDEARAWQWSFWVVTELDAPIIQWISNSVSRPMEKRDSRLAIQARETIEWPLQVLNEELSHRECLVDGCGFSVADLNVASVLYRLLFLDLSQKPHLESWLKRCWERPAAKRARALRET